MSNRQIHPLSPYYRSLPRSLTVSADTIRSFWFLAFRPKVPILIHIPRTGGTLLAHHLYGQSVLHLTCSELLPLFALFPNRRVYAFLRDPLDRFISAINFVMTGGSEVQPLSLDLDVKGLMNKSGEDFRDALSILAASDRLFLPQHIFLKSAPPKIEVYPISCLEQFLDKTTKSRRENYYAEIQRKHSARRYVEQRSFSKQQIEIVERFYRTDKLLYGRAALFHPLRQSDVTTIIGGK